MPRLKGVSSVTVTAAVTELGAYYQKFQGVSEADARAFAQSKVRDIVGSGHNCNEYTE